MAVWYTGTLTNNGAYCVINKSDFNGYEGYYKCSIIAVDKGGNKTSASVPYDIYMGNLVEVIGISNEDNSETGISINSNPVIFGKMKFWFKEYDLDYNYYLNVYVDNNRVLFNQPSDDNGFLSYVIDTSLFSEGQHTVKVELYDTKTMYSDEKSFIVSSAHNIIFNANRGLVLNKSSVECTLYSYQGYYSEVSWMTPIRDGYTFLGWYTSPSGGDKVYNADGSCVNGTGYWENNTCKQFS